MIRAIRNAAFAGLFLLCSFAGLHSRAQTVNVYSSSGAFKSSYSSIKSALAAVDDGDSLLLSPHSFKEHDLNSTKNIIYQGTISGTDTTTIDADGKQFCFKLCSGTIRNVVFTGTRNSGCVLARFTGRLTGHTTFRDCGDNSSAATITMASGVIDEHVTINNCRGQTSLSLLGHVVIKDNVVIAGNDNNLFTIGLIDYAGADSSVASLVIQDQVSIQNNRSSFSCISLYNGASLNMTGGSIAYNIIDSIQYGTIHAGNMLHHPSFNASASVTLKNVRFYNPQKSAHHRIELNMARDTKPKNFHTASCWWGNSDTSGLIRVDPFNSISMPDYAIADWKLNNGLPVGSLSSWPVSATMKLNTGASLPPGSFPMLNAQFSPIGGGSFSAASVPINTANTMSSTYTKPGSGTYPLRALIDADTFRANSDGLSITIPGAGLELKAWPNPLKDKLQVSGLTEGCRLIIYNAAGQQLIQQTATIPFPGLDLSALPAGIYLLQVSSPEGYSGSVQIQKL